jgi:hypothetical protein
MKRKWTADLLIAPFRSFGLASVYGFVSAMLLGLALNLFVSVHVTDRMPSNSRSTFYVAAFAFLIGALGFFLVTWNLENARTQWISEGASRSERLLREPIEMRLVQLYLGLFLGVLGCIGGSYLTMLRSVSPS